MWYGVAVSRPAKVHVNFLLVLELSVLNMTVWTTTYNHCLCQKRKFHLGDTVSSETLKNQNSIRTYILSHEAFWIFSGEFCDVTQLGATPNGNLIGSFCCTFRTFRAFQHQHPVAVRPVSADVGGPAPLSLLAAVAMVRGSPWRRQLRGSGWRLYRGEVVQLERNPSVHLGWYDRFRSLISPDMLQRSHY